MRAAQPTHPVHLSHPVYAMHSVHNSAPPDSEVPDDELHNDDAPGDKLLDDSTLAKNTPVTRMSLVVPLRERASRIDELVVNWLKNTELQVSRGAVQQWIAAGYVRVDGQPCKPSHHPAPGATIDIDPPPLPQNELRPNPSIHVEVLYEDAHVVVVNKPANLVVHPARGHTDDTLVNGLLAMGLLNRDINDPRDPFAHIRPGIVHRLDKDTSGLVVVARTEQARDNLKSQFQARTIERLYEAVVVGTATDATYDTCYARHPLNRLKYTSWCENDRPAITHVRVIQVLSGGKTTHVQCRLQTGRTHQIRVHLSERGQTPVLGDTLYGTKSPHETIRAIADELQRHWLHARVLGFTHPATARQMLFEQPAPEQLQRTLEVLRGTSE